MSLNTLWGKDCVGFAETAQGRWRTCPDEFVGPDVGTGADADGAFTPPWRPVHIGGCDDDAVELVSASTGRLAAAIHPGPASLPVRNRASL